MARPGLIIHAKFRRAMHLLGVSKPLLLGTLELLWSGGYENGDPIIGDALDVELAADWDGTTGKLVEALASCGGVGRAGFIEPVEGREGIWQIHDLFDHAPDYVNKRAEREASRRLKGQTISDVRRKAAEARWSKAREASEMQTDATDFRLHANGVTPAPAPAPGKKRAAHAPVADLYGDAVNGKPVADSPHARAIAAWMPKWAATHNGEKYPFRSKDAAHVADLLKRLAGDESKLVRVFERFLACTEPFFQGHDLGVLVAKLPKFLVDPVNGVPNGKRNGPTFNATGGRSGEPDERSRIDTLIARGEQA